MNIDKFFSIFKNKFKAHVKSFKRLEASGSARVYYRFFTDNISYIACYNGNVEENKLYFNLTKYLSKNSMMLPKIYFISDCFKYYIIQDLGDSTLFKYILEIKNSNDYHTHIYTKYKLVIDKLFNFNFQVYNNFDFNLCSSFNYFDRDYILKDIYYFRSFFLQLNYLDFDEKNFNLESIKFADFLFNVDNSYFMHRDFQSANILLYDKDVYFIDFQSACRGPLQYDIASLLYDSKVSIGLQLREKLLIYYCDLIESNNFMSRKDFLFYYYPYVLIRLMQAFGAYGFRGIYERKAEFIASIYPAICDLRSILHKLDFLVDFPSIYSAIYTLLNLEYSFDLKKLKGRMYLNKIFIFSLNCFDDYNFSDFHLVFDCRAITNLQDKSLLGFNALNDYVYDYFSSSISMRENLKSFTLIIDDFIKNNNQNFHLMKFAFICDNGIHRSVYCSEYVAKYIKKRFFIDVFIEHSSI